MFNSFICKINHKTMKIAHDHADWVKYIQDKLNVFERNNGWRFIPTPPYAYVVGLKWVF